MCDIEEDVSNFYKRYSECKGCNRSRGLKRYYEEKHKVSMQQKIYYEKKRNNPVTKTKQ